MGGQIAEYGPHESVTAPAPGHAEVSAGRAAWPAGRYPWVRLPAASLKAAGTPDGEELEAEPVEELVVAQERRWEERRPAAPVARSRPDGMYVGPVEDASPTASWEWTPSPPGAAGLEGLTQSETFAGADGTCVPAWTAATCSADGTGVAEVAGVAAEAEQVTVG